MRSRRAIPRVDREIFKRTANHTKAVNLGVLRYRGGVRF